jgi:hypothetical protein
MKAALAIAAAEIRQHRLVLWAGLTVGFLPLLLNYAWEGAPLRPDAHSQARPDLYTGSAGEFLVWAFAWILSLAVALGLGATVVSRDLGERRLGFWLGRPVPLVQYWAGKVGAALLLAVLAGALVMLPAHLWGSLSWGATSFSLFRRSGDLLRLWLMLLALMVAAAGVMGAAFRARGALLILDIVMVPLVWAATVAALGSTWQAGTGEVVVTQGVPRLLCAALAVLLAAGAAQVCLGRLELRRGHALLSAITWGGLLLFFVGGILAFSRYVASEAPADLRLPHGVWVDVPEAGGHVVLAGSSARWSHRFEPGFVIDAQGRSVPIGGFEGMSGLAWSRDGRQVAVSRYGFGPSQGPERHLMFLSTFGWGPTLVVRSLDRPEAARRFRLEDDLAAAAVSPSGRRVLLRSTHGKQVLSLESGKMAAALEDPLPWSHAAFLDEATIRALRSDRRPTPELPQPESSRQVASITETFVGERDAAARATPLQQITVVDWDLESGRVRERGTIALQGSRTFFAGLTPGEGWRTVLRHDATGLYLHDLDGHVVATLVSGWTKGNRAAGPLSGNRYGCIEEEPSGLHLRVFGSDGRLLWEARLTGRFPLRVGGEPRPGLLALGVAPLADEGERATLLVDLASGSVVRREPGLSPAVRRWEPSNDVESTHLEPGSLATRLFLGDDGLVSLDPATGARTVLVARRRRLAED